MDLSIVDAALALLGNHSISELLITFLFNSRYSDSPQLKSFFEQWPTLLTLIGTHPILGPLTEQSMLQSLSTTLTTEVKHLAEKESGWHVSARHARADQLEHFSLDDMSSRMQEQAPILSALLGALLDSDPQRSARQARFSESLEREDARCDVGVDSAGTDWDEEDEYWWGADLDMFEGHDSNEALNSDEKDVRGENGGSSASDAATKRERLRKRRERAAARRSALIGIRRVIIMSIMMFSTNQKCNALAAVMGIFLHSTSTPELVVEVFAHAGLSVSTTTIHNMVNSLSHSAHEKLRSLAKTRTLAFAYDNFDMDFKSWSATIEHPGQTLKHATSALAFPLEHGITSDDLKHSAALWSRNPLNPHALPDQLHPAYIWADLLSPPTPEVSGRTARTLAWHFRHALVTYQKSFEKFRDSLGVPETVLQIPIKKTTHLPCRAMDIDQSTVDGQAEILESLFTQANIGDPTDFPEVLDIREHVILVHGDLGTAERLDASQRSRSIEGKPLRRLENIIFVFGLFHLQMAAADAIWRMFIEPKAQRTAPNGLYQQACKVRPRDSGRIGSKPGFRLMHDLILQCATARILDVWRNEVEHSKRASLDDYAKSASWSEIEKLSLLLVKKYLDQTSAKDKEFRNNTLILGRLLDYVELTHAMKHGDIGRVEETFLQWAFIFKSVGKHKYSAHLIKTSINLRFIYPSSLVKAIRLNWLCNPTGRQDGFRAVDWLVELMNLYIKVVYSSSGYARTFQLILKQSPLIEVFRGIHRTMQDNFHLLHRSVRHAPPDLSNTIRALCDELQKHRAYENLDGRKSYDLVHHVSIGILTLQTQTMMNTGEELLSCADGDQEGEFDEIEEIDLGLDEQ